jgi:hypothetical protein
MAASLSRPPHRRSRAAAFDMPPNFLAVVDMHDVMQMIGAADCKWPAGQLAPFSKSSEHGIGKIDLYLHAAVS